MVDTIGEWLCLGVAYVLAPATVVLIAVFVPTAFISGITGQFYRQFALTIAAATLGCVLRFSN